MKTPVISGLHKITVVANTMILPIFMIEGTSKF